MPRDLVGVGVLDQHADEPARGLAHPQVGARVVAGRQRHLTVHGFEHEPDRRGFYEVSREEREKLWNRLYGEPGFGIWLANFREIFMDEKANGSGIVPYLPLTELQRRGATRAPSQGGDIIEGQRNGVTARFLKGKKLRVTHNITTNCCFRAKTKTTMKPVYMRTLPFIFLYVHFTFSRSLF